MKKLPEHVAIIMDGNGRWANQRGKQRGMGHKKGASAVREIIEEAADNGIKYLTLFTFSTENWSRPEDEVGILMRLLLSSLKKEFNRLNNNNIKLKSIGDLEGLPHLVREELNYVVEKTKDNTGLTLTLALNYGAKEELTNAMRTIANKVKNSIISPEKVDQSMINEHLYSHYLPAVDLLIRTSGEERISNFLLWQLSYTEIFFEKKLWPDFTGKDFDKIMNKFKNIKRNFGSI